MCIPLISAELQQLVKELHSKVAVLEEEVYDWEIKIRKQDFEVSWIPWLSFCLSSSLSVSLSV